MRDALRNIFGQMFEATLQGEMDSHLGCGSNDRGAKSTSNRRNGYTDKTVKSGIGEIDIRTPQDLDVSLERQLIPKRAKAVSGIEDKVLICSPIKTVLSAQGINLWKIRAFGAL